MRTKIIGHRGYMGKYPENTLLSFQQAVNYGADAIELDVHYSKDKKLIVHHDYYLGNLNNGEGLILDTNSEYIKSLVINKTSSTYKEEKIPFLKDVFKEIKNKVGYEIEMKGLTEDFIEEVVHLASVFNLLNSIEFTSPHVYLLSYLKNKYPKTKIGMFVSLFPSWMSLRLGQKIILANALLGKVNVLHCPITVLTDDYVRELHKNNILVHAANCNTKVDLLNAFRLSVDQLSTDEVELSVQVRSEYHEK